MLDKTYQPADIEARIHDIWEKAEAFRAGRPDRAAAKPYCIVIPPPNVTGSLHMGHALNNTLQDILCRFERMRGRDVLWQPGMDHAGIATQLVVTRQLAERQIDYTKLGREKFLEEVWRWKAQSGGAIINQLKRLGASCDWSRERFTMDEGLSKAVLKVFVDLHKAGLIYKDKRLVNWDPEFQSAISDLEVEPREHTGSFKWSRSQVDKDGNSVEFDPAALAKVLGRDPNGHMYTVRYPLVGVAYNPDDPATYLMVGTTRPETMLGDTGVAIHPENPKLKHLIGAKCVLPLTGREIPIVGDTYADPEKGTGAVKITPAHDFNDWEVGQRCGLEIINIFTATAILNDSVPASYRGLDRYEARERTVADLASQDLLERIEPHTLAVPHAQRGDAVVEPWLTDQWYVDAATLAKPALAAVKNGRTRIIPEKYAADYYRWLEDIKPWCISRQLWWGHQIPAWYGRKKHPNPGASGLHTVPFETEMFIALSEQEAVEAARTYYGMDVVVVSQPPVFDATRDSSKSKWDLTSPSGPAEIWRDPDVLDTWFSSGLWPFSTLGWPDQTKELARYYPTSCLVTGFDIIFFWVARMMMLGCHFMPDVPFDDVYIHGLVRDEKGRKMSKSIGNVIDPLDLIDKYGADALRFTMAALTTQGRDVKLTTSRVEGYRNFATKLWNAARFAEVNACKATLDFDPKSVKETLNRWIVGETERASAAVTAALEAYKFSEASNAVYAFVWDVFCDWYIELAKPLLTGQDAAAKAETQACVPWVMDHILELLHPFMPFLTEELWAKTTTDGAARGDLLCLSPWPALQGLANADADEEIGWVVQLIKEIRSLRSEMNVPAGAKMPLVLTGASKSTRARAARHAETLMRLARLDRIERADVAPRGSAQFVLGEATVALPLAGVIDMAAEKGRLAKEIAKAEDEIRKVEGRLANKAFVDKAPLEIVEENRERIAAFGETVTRLKAALARVEAA